MRKWIEYITLMVALFGIFVVFQSFGILLLLIFFLLLPFLSFYVWRYQTKNLEFSLESPVELLEKKEPFSVKVKVTNNSKLPILSCYTVVEYKNRYREDKKKEILYFSATSKKWSESEFVVEKNIASETCGVIDVTITEAGLMDFMGLFLKKWKNPVTKEVIILPLKREGVVMDSHLYACESSEPVESQGKGSDIMEVSDVREYIPGDCLKDIHWKLSAKTGDLMVKEREARRDSMVALVIELINDEFGIVDGILDYSFSLCQSLFVQGQPFYLYWWSETSGMIKERLVSAKTDLFSAFQEILREETYEDRKRARTEVFYENATLEHIVVVDNDDHFSYVERGE